MNSDYSDYLMNFDFYSQNHSPHLIIRLRHPPLAERMADITVQIIILSLSDVFRLDSYNKNLGIYIFYFVMYIVLTNKKFV